MSDAVEQREIDETYKAKTAKKRSTSKKKAAAPTRLYADVDTAFEKVVEADQTGADIVFDLDLFPTYTQEQRNALREQTRKLYEMAEVTVGRRGAVDLDEEEVLNRIMAESNNNYARGRLEVWEKHPDYDYKWVYPTDVKEYRERYYLEVVSGTGEKTAANPTGKGMHMIGKQGARELVLMRRKKSISKALDKKRIEQFNRQAGLVKDEYKSRGEREGVPVFTGEDEVALRNEFQDVAESRIREG